jgi:hypothetical protein
MKWEKNGIRDLRLIKISEEEKAQLESLLKQLYDPISGCADAETMAKNLNEDILKRGYLENRNLNRSETVAQLSTWCDAAQKHRRGKPWAQEISKLLFGGNILPRLVDKSSNQVSNATRILDEFIDKMIKDSEMYRPLNIMPPEEDRKQSFVPENQPPESFPSISVSLEEDLRNHIAHDPGIIEPDLKLKKGGIGYHTEMGNLDFLCEDRDGNNVVIELRKGHSGDQAVGQILRYMGWLKKNEGHNVRGIIVLEKPDEKVTYAASAVPTIKVLYYKVQFEITETPPNENP